MTCLKGIIWHPLIVWLYATLTPHTTRTCKWLPWYAHFKPKRGLSLAYDINLNPSQLCNCKAINGTPPLWIGFPLHHHTPSLPIKYCTPLILMEGQLTTWREFFMPGAFNVAWTLMIGIPNYKLDGVVVKIVPWLDLQVNPKYLIFSKLEVSSPPTLENKIQE